MLKTLELIENVKEDYIPMLRMVNIPDFTKCIAIFSGLELDKISDKMIKQYLVTWAENKFRIFKMLGNSLKKDIKFTYTKLSNEKEMDWQVLENEFPRFGPWLETFSEFPTNKIDTNHYYYSTKSMRKFFPNINVNGMSITHFAKKYLELPDEVVTGIGRIYENNEVNANYTISIDPIDMMTASENPYDWCSCYRLETDNCESHADGCMAAVLDKASTIAYVWTSEGKLKLYDKYELKSIRYKRMRQWVNLSDNLTTICFNDLYPGKFSYSDTFEKQLRDLYEGVIAEHLNERNYWKNCDRSCHREYNEYGYSEFNNRLLVLGEHEPEDINVYTEAIECACGCGFQIPGSYDCDDEYLGIGFRCGGWEDRYYCDYCDEYCNNGGDCSEENCRGCSYWDESHPLCPYNEDTCENYCGDHEVEGGYCVGCKHLCNGCSNYEGEEDDSEDESEELD